MSETALQQSIDLSDLPGAEIVSLGLADLSCERESVPALLLEIAAPRFRLAGLNIPVALPHALDAEIRLYRLLGTDPDVDAYSQYNAHLRRLSSLCRALEARARRNRV
jgi:hypothetical protein